MGAGLNAMSSRPHVLLLESGDTSLNQLNRKTLQGLQEAVVELAGEAAGAQGQVQPRG